jgi:hypothetical protein
MCCEWHNMIEMVTGREGLVENSKKLSRALRNCKAAGSDFKAELEQPSAHIPLWLVREACQRVLTCKLNSQYVNQAKH